MLSNQLITNQPTIKAGQSAAQDWSTCASLVPLSASELRFPLVAITARKGVRHKRLIIAQYVDRENTILDVV